MAKIKGKGYFVSGLCIFTGLLIFRGCTGTLKSESKNKVDIPEITHPNFEEQFIPGKEQFYDEQQEMPVQTEYIIKK